MLREHTSLMVAHLAGKAGDATAWRPVFSTVVFTECFTLLNVLFFLSTSLKDFNPIFLFSSECFAQTQLVQSTAHNSEFTDLWKSDLLPTELFLQKAITQRSIKRKTVLVKIPNTTQLHHYCFWKWTHSAAWWQAGRSRDGSVLNSTCRELFMATGD